MATFGAMWAGLSATAPRLARDRERGWADYLATTPLRYGQILIGRIVAGLVVALPAIVAVGIAAVVAHGVSLEAWQWLAGLGLLWIGTAPFVALGIAIGSLANSTVAFAASTGLWFAFAALGGLWVPPGVLSPGIRHFATALPSYNQAALGWHVASGTAPTASNFLVLVAWTVGLALLPLLARTVRRRSRRDRSAERSRRPSTVCARTAPRSQALRSAVVRQPVLRRPQALRSPVVRPSNSATSPSSTARSAPSMAWTLDLPRLVADLDLADLLGRRTDRLSGGQAQRVRFALALAGNPAVLVLDEPTAALDVQARRDLWSTLDGHIAQHPDLVVLFSTHYLEEADQHAARIVLLGAGRVIADGTPDQVRAAAGTERLVGFQLRDGDPQRFRTMTAVTAVSVAGKRVTLRTTDADATLWSLYPFRDAITEISVDQSSLEDAFLTLACTQPVEGTADGRAGIPPRAGALGHP